MGSFNTGRSGIDREMEGILRWAEVELSWGRSSQLRVSFSAPQILPSRLAKLVVP